MTRTRVTNLETWILTWPNTQELELTLELIHNTYDSNTPIQNCTNFGMIEYNMSEFLWKNVF